MKKFIALVAILVTATSCLGFGGGFGFHSTLERITPGTTINQTCEQDYYPGTTIIQSVNVGGILRWLTRARFGLSSPRQIQAARQE